MSQEDMKFIDYAWGGFFGVILGFIVAKVYQTWAIAYRDSQYDLNPVTGWDTGSPPIWIYATEHPTSYSLIVVSFFFVIGILFVAYMRNKVKSTEE